MNCTLYIEISLFHLFTVIVLIVLNSVYALLNSHKPTLVF